MIEVYDYEGRPLSYYWFLLHLIGIASKDPELYKFFNFAQYNRQDINRMREVASQALMKLYDQGIFLFANEKGIVQEGRKFTSKDHLVAADALLTLKKYEAFVRRTMPLSL